MRPTRWFLEGWSACCASRLCNRADLIGRPWGKRTAAPELQTTKPELLLPQRGVLSKSCVVRRPSRSECVQARSSRYRADIEQEASDHRAYFKVNEEENIFQISSSLDQHTKEIAKADQTVVAPNVNSARWWNPSTTNTPITSAALFIAL